ncbi:MAG TPA: sigma-70 family RNA polymerase sigma factor [Chitinophaga sp.]|uniref:RNA polymerase sigma factor n=1 Tax=Chitinophaga sp. TaxID=1869181 RepID=UPI002BC2C296|nr:sigma-70 family RNA polymerase sigma factor [Chitinophaga sp.]HVI45642.1 sigma-70 family RNA polymerase sigma factor [Chitinophaga sp.]
MDSEAELLQGLSKGNEKALEIIYSRYFVHVFGLASRFIPNRHAAEDIVLDSFTRLWEKRAEFPADTRLKPYLFTLVKNASLNYLRGMGREQIRYRKIEAELQQVKDFEDETIGLEFDVFRSLYNEIERLPGKLPAVMSLSLKGWKNQEIAEQLGLKEKTVRNLKVEAIKLLKVNLTDKDVLLLLLMYCIKKY